jgi:hypothetical protein
MVNQRNAFSTLDTTETEDLQQVRPSFVAPIAIITNVVNAALAPFLNPTPGQPAPQNPTVASRDGEDTINPSSTASFMYDVTAADWDGDDEVTVTVSDAADYPHLHGLANFFNPAAGHTATITLAIKPQGEEALPEPAVQQELEETSLEAESSTPHSHTTTRSPTSTPPSTRSTGASLTRASKTVCTR